MQNIALINGPNLNILEQRKNNLYGTLTLKNINTNISNKFSKIINIKTFQSNHEGKLVDYIQETRNWSIGILINASAFSHTSIAIHDAILDTKLPCVEIHLTNIYSREHFRHKSIISNACIGKISGFGAYSYELGIHALINDLYNKGILEYKH